MDSRSNDPDNRPAAPAPSDGGDERDERVSPDTSELLAEIHALRSAIEQTEKHRRRRAMVMLAALLTLIPLGVLGAHLAIDYESGRVAEAIEKSSGPFTDEALRRACRAIKIPLFGPETKKRLGCPKPSEPESTETTNPESTTTTPPPSAP